MKTRVPCSLAFSALLLMSAAEGLAFTSPGRAPLPNLDNRTKEPQAEAAPSAAQRGAVEQLRSRLPEARVDFDPVTAAPKLVSAGAKFLSGANGQGQAISAAVAAGFEAADPHRATKAFLREHSGLFGHGPEILDQARVARDFTTPHSGLKTVVWEQQVDGVPIFEAVLISHTSRNGELVNLSSQFLPDPSGAADRGLPNRAAHLATPEVSARQAVALAARNVGEDLQEEGITPVEPDPQAATLSGPEKRQEFKAAVLQGTASARLVWLPASKDRLDLCWDVVLMSRTRQEMFRVLVDVPTGELRLRRCLTDYLSDATYRVYTSDSPSPFSPGYSTPFSIQPPEVPRTLLTFSALDTNASPNGWIDDGVNETRGNNVDAHTDLNNDNQPDLPRPQGSPFRVFDFPLDLTQSPSTYRSAAVVQLFYWNNFMHDRLYELGFTEAAGNFQNTNFARGGLGNDAVQADAQDGGGYNNANFSTPPDGSAGRMQMYLFNGPTPDRDGDLDAEVILHEYTHGLSNRRVGGGVGISALQSGGMGEGWSDFYAMALLSEPGDDVNGAYASGGYVTYQLGGLTQNYYYGIRRYPYCTDMTKNPLTFKDIDPAQASSHAGVARSPIIGSTASEVHNMGEVWCMVLREARANLISRHGWASGNQLILQLVTDGMNLSPANPNFLQARDAILQADLVDNGGANRAQLWAAFAKRGMGYSATSPSSSTTSGLHEAFDVPDDLVILPAALSVIGPPGGPFTPSPAFFTLTNSGSTTLTWTLASTSVWVNVSATSGTLAVGTATNVAVAVTADANTFAPGMYTAGLWFTNQTSGVAQPGTFALAVVGWHMFDDFEPGIDLSQWSGFGGTVGSTMLATNYGGSVSGPNSLWFGDDGSRYATTLPMNTTSGGMISFSIRLANGSGWPWELVDYLPYEGVVLESSTNSGTTWATLGQYTTTAYYDWIAVNLAIPASAQAPATLFRWRQLSHSGASFDHWALDSVSILAEDLAPTITAQPQSQSIAVGDSATLSVLAFGTQPLSYQWLINGTNLSGATASSLVWTSVQPSDAGTYSVLVSNILGTVLSSNALLTVYVPLCVPPPQGLVGWWRAEGDAGDDAGNNNGTLKGGAGFASGRVGQAFGLNGTGSYVEVPSSPALKPAGPFTMESWINYDTLIGSYLATIVAKGPDADGPIDWALFVNTTRKVTPALYVGGRWTFFDCASTLTTGVWYHVAMVYDGASLRGYVNGALDGSTAASGTVRATDTTLRIGAYAPVNGAAASKGYFPGRVDELSFYSRALSASEIQAIYSAGNAGKCAGPLPPYITSQPTNHTVIAGTDVTFSVAAGGSRPLSYQWCFGGTNLPGATTASLALTNAQASVAGNYVVVVTNALGSIASSNAVLTVTPAPLCVAVPSGLVSWWRGQDDVSDVLGAHNGTLSGGLTFASGEVGQALSFNGVDAAVDLGTWFNLQTFSMGMWVKAGASQVAYADIVDNNHSSSPWRSWVVAYQNTGLRFAWQLLSTGGGLASIPFDLKANTWQYLVLTLDSNRVAQVYLDGQVQGTATLNAAISYDGTQFLRLGRCACGGRYFNGLLDEVDIYNRALAVSEIQDLYQSGSTGKCADSIPPSIMFQPASQTAVVGSNVAFIVTAAGSPPLSYQWSFNGTALPGQTDNVLTLISVQITNAGAYTVLVGNSVGSTVSSNAVLTVSPTLPCLLPPLGLVSWWRAEGDASDNTGTNNGNLKGGAGFAPGRVGQAFGLNGTGNYVEVPSNSALKPTGPFTVETWMNYDTLIGSYLATIVSKRVLRKFL